MKKNLILKSINPLILIFALLAFSFTSFAGPVTMSAPIPLQTSESVIGSPTPGQIYTASDDILAIKHPPISNSTENFNPNPTEVTEKAATAQDVDFTYWLDDFVLTPGLLVWSGSADKDFMIPGSTFMQGLDAEIHEITFRGAGNVIFADAREPKVGEVPLVLPLIFLGGTIEPYSGASNFPELIIPTSSPAFRMAKINGEDIVLVSYEPMLLNANGEAHLVTSPVFYLKETKDGYRLAGAIGRAVDQDKDNGGIRNDQARDIETMQFGDANAETIAVLNSDGNDGYVIFLSGTSNTWTDINNNNAFSWPSTKQLAGPWALDIAVTSDKVNGTWSDRLMVPYGAEWSSKTFSFLKYSDSTHYKTVLFPVPSFIFEHINRGCRPLRIECTRYRNTGDPTGEPYDLNDDGCGDCVVTWGVPDLADGTFLSCTDEPEHLTVYLNEKINNECSTQYILKEAPIPTPQEIYDPQVGGNNTTAAKPKLLAIEIAQADRYNDKRLDIWVGDHTLYDLKTDAGDVQSYVYLFQGQINLTNGEWIIGTGLPFAAGYKLSGAQLTGGVKAIAADRHGNIGVLNGTPFIPLKDVCPTIPGLQTNPKTCECDNAIFADKDSDGWGDLYRQTTIGTETIFFIDMNEDGSYVGGEDFRIFASTLPNATTTAFIDTNSDGVMNAWEYSVPAEEIVKCDTCVYKSKTGDFLPYSYQAKCDPINNGSVDMQRCVNELDNGKYIETPSPLGCRVPAKKTCTAEPKDGLECPFVSDPEITYNYYLSSLGAGQSPYISGSSSVSVEISHAGTPAATLSLFVGNNDDYDGDCIPDCVIDRKGNIVPCDNKLECDANYYDLSDECIDMMKTDGLPDCNKYDPDPSAVPNVPGASLDLPKDALYSMLSFISGFVGEAEAYTIVKLDKLPHIKGVIAQPTLLVNKGGKKSLIPDDEDQTEPPITGGRKYSCVVDVDRGELPDDRFKDFRLIVRQWNDLFRKVTGLQRDIFLPEFVGTYTIEAYVRNAPVYNDAQNDMSVGYLGLASGQKIKNYQATRQRPVYTNELVTPDKPVRYLPTDTNIENDQISRDIAPKDAQDVSLSITKGAEQNSLMINNALNVRFDDLTTAQMDIGTGVKVSPIRKIVLSGMGGLDGCYMQVDPCTTAMPVIDQRNMDMPSVIKAAEEVAKTCNGTCSDDEMMDRIFAKVTWDTTGFLHQKFVFSPEGERQLISNKVSLSSLPNGTNTKEKLAYENESAALDASGSVGCETADLLLTQTASAPFGGGCGCMMSGAEPTLADWALVMLGIACASVGFMVVRRRSRSVH